jgi:hypothetical protein
MNQSREAHHPAGAVTTTGLPRDCQPIAMAATYITNHPNRHRLAASA